MTEKFTKEPWKIEERQAHCNGFEMYGFAIRTETKRICMCQTDDPENIPTMKANAHLISTAPEMYWMLEELKGDLNALTINPNVSEQVKASAWLCVKHIERVQKKARGEA